MGVTSPAVPMTSGTLHAPSAHREVRAAPLEQRG